jgi:ATP/maltotriose-dependent transcriptional regulator MalT
MAIPEAIALPPLFRRHMRRPRLTRLLDESTAQAIVINAPAGYGKTTLAAEWLQGRDKVAWYRGSLGSADVAALSVGLAQAVRPIVRGSGERLEQRVRVGDAPEKAARSLAELLADDLSSWPKGAWVVIDDYHLVMESAPVEEFVDWLLMLSPVRLLVTTRRRPGWASARRELYGEVLEITREQLSMRTGEARTVLAGRPSDANRELMERAEGWPALIGLAALTESSDLPQEQVSDALFRYFAEEVLRQQPPDTQEFMLLASVLPSFDLNDAREILGFIEPQAILDRLRSEGLLYDANGRFHFHPLLRDFLWRKIASENPRRESELAERGVNHAILGQRWEEAFELARQADQSGLAAEVAGQAAPRLLAEGRVETLEKWIALCEPLSFDQVGAMLAKSEILDRRGRPSESRLIARDLLSSLPPSSPSAPRAWLLAGRASHSLCDFDEALRCQLRARQLAVNQNERADAAWGAFLSAAALEREDLVDLLRDVKRTTPRTLDGRLRLAAARWQFSEYSGSLATVSESDEPLVRQAEQAIDPLAKTNALANFSYNQTLAGEFDTAHALASRALELCRLYHLDFAIGYCLVRRGRAEVGARRLSEARATRAELAPLVAYSEDAFLRLEYGLFLRRLQVAEGRLDTNTSLLNTVDPDRMPRGPYGEFISLSALMNAARGNSLSVREEIAQARGVTSSIGSRFLTRFAEVIDLQIQKGDTLDLREAATTLVHDARAACFLESFIVAYRAHPPLLRLLSEPATHQAVRRAMTNAGDGGLAHRYGIRVQLSEESMFFLTPREQEVLDLLNTGRSNAEISQRLFISQSTVKVHVHRILRKMGVKSRVEAVIKWNAIHSSLKQPR